VFFSCTYLEGSIVKSQINKWGQYRRGWRPWIPRQRDDADRRTRKPEQQTQAAQVRQDHLNTTGRPDHGPDAHLCRRRDGASGMSSFPFASQTLKRNKDAFFSIKAAKELIIVILFSLSSHSCLLFYVISSMLFVFCLLYFSILIGLSILPLLVFFALQKLLFVFKRRYVDKSPAADRGQWNRRYALLECPE
jgi:hypothetical protein